MQVNPATLTKVTIGVQRTSLKEGLNNVMEENPHLLESLHDTKQQKNADAAFMFRQGTGEIMCLKQKREEG